MSLAIELDELDVEAGILQLADVAADRALARADLGGEIADAAASLEAAECVEHA